MKRLYELKMSLSPSNIVVEKKEDKKQNYKLLGSVP